MNLKITTLNPSKKYLLAVSGGVDSMVLAHLFLQEKINFELVHCNFKLREKESDEDEKLVNNWCQKNKIKFYSQSFDTEKLALDLKKSIQETARELRYKYFKELKTDLKFDWIVTAHHADDNIETLLFHLFRGTGIKGLTGIPKNENGILRPLLHVTKEEIKAYALLHQIDFREDQSNNTNKYARNNLRNEIIPFIEKSFPDLKNNLQENINRFGEAYEIYSNAVEKERNRMIEKRNEEYYIPIRKIPTCSPLDTIFYELVKPFHFNFKQSQEALRLINAANGTYVESVSHRIIKHGNHLIITKLKITESAFHLIESFTSKIVLPIGTIDLEQKKEFPKKFSIDLKEIYINADELNFPIIFRPWKQGDYIYPFGLNKKKKVARILIDAKIPLHEKEKIWVMESNQKIVWIIGITLDHRFRLKPTTQNIFKFYFKA